MSRRIGLVLFCLVFSICAFAQTGTLKGVLTDAISGEPVPFANVVAFKNGSQVAGTTTDFDGNYTIKPLDPGNYDLKSTTYSVIKSNSIHFHSKNSGFFVLILISLSLPVNLITNHFCF